MKAVVIGGGPAGLMACEALLGSEKLTAVNFGLTGLTALDSSVSKGLTPAVSVMLCEAKPSVARKFLMAGKSGLNLSKMEPFADFMAAYPGGEPLRGMLEAFGPSQVKDWAEGLGQPCFIGSTGRLFPVAMKGSPLLRAWLARLDALGLDRRVRWRWTGWDGDALVFDTPAGVERVVADVVVLALGGGSWARLGSDGAWLPLLAAAGVPVVPFAPSNAGLLVDWSAHMAPHFGKPLKNVVFRCGAMENRGEAVISARGLEGGGLYPLGPALREGQALTVDLLPDLAVGVVAERLAKQRGGLSLANVLRKGLKLDAAAQALVMEMGRPLPSDPGELARLVKGLPLRHAGLRPLDEAISTVGGVPWAALDGLMLKARPGVFVAGEMIDWDAPTGGYLLTACLATGLAAGRQAAAFIAS